MNFTKEGSVSTSEVGLMLGGHESASSHEAFEVPIISANEVAHQPPASAESGAQSMSPAAAPEAVIKPVMTETQRKALFAWWNGWAIGSFFTGILVWWIGMMPILGQFTVYLGLEAGLVWPAGVSLLASVGSALLVTLPIFAAAVALFYASYWMYQNRAIKYLPPSKSKPKSWPFGLTEWE